MALTPEQTRQGYLNLWGTMSIRAGRRPALKALVAKLVSGRERYEAVEKATGVPWWFIAILHEREASCNFSTYLGNGEPLHRVTRLVPKGRGPFETWVDGAIDALTLEGFAGQSDWSLPTVLYRCEAYNGWGYARKSVNSPYVWSWTSEYEGGKYIADGYFSASAIDPQPGCAAMLRGLIDAGYVSLPDATTPAQPAPQAGDGTGSATTPAASADAAPVAAPTPQDDDPPWRDTVWVQQTLNALGASPALVVDGIAGPATRAAIRLFQKGHGLEADGIAGHFTLAAMEAALATPEPQ